MIVRCMSVFNLSLNSKKEDARNNGYRKKSKALFVYDIWILFSFGQER